MNTVKPRVLIITAALLAGCGEKAPEIPPPEPTAAFFQPALLRLLPQQATTLVAAVPVNRHS